mgnify:CR=1 FL=1
MIVNQTTPPTSAVPPRPNGRRSFLIVAGCFCAIFVIAIIVQLNYVRQLSQRIIGDGVTVESYQFDLANFDGQRDLLIPSGLPKNGQPAMVDPPILTQEQLAKLNENEFRRAVVGNDMVIGVVVEGEARAYPIRFMNWHEIVNDTLGGRAIAVTFNPICRSAVVFDRTVPGDDEPIVFGYSGLLYNHNLLMFDRQGEKDSSEGESLWSQLKFEAVAGPRKGEQLTVLPCRLMRFSQWQQLHPETTVINGLDRFKKRYKRTPYQDIFRTGKPQFPVAPAPPEDGLLIPGDMIAAFPDGEQWAILPQPFANTEKLPSEGPVIYARWFAWYAMHPQSYRIIEVQMPEQRTLPME